MPAASFSHRSTVEAPAAVVWARLQEAESWAEIGPIDEVWDPAHDPDGALRSFRWSTRAAGRGFEGTATVSHSTPPQRMVVDLVTSEVAGAVDVQLDQDAITVDMALRSVGFLATMFFGVVADAVGGGLGTHVDHFAAQFS